MCLGPIELTLVGVLSNTTSIRVGKGTVMLIEMCSGAVGFGAIADQCWVVGISGGSVERSNLMPDREAFSHLGSPLSRAEPMPSWSKVCRYIAEC